MADFDITQYGAIGDGKTLDTQAIQKAIDAASAAGGGRVVATPGKVYLTGTFSIKANVELHVPAGATIIASERREDYPNDQLRCLVEAVEADNISITGTGVIDGRAKLFMTGQTQYIYKGSMWRPRLVGLIGCRNVTIRDITFRDSANWGLHLTGCTDVVISGCRILNDLKVPNCDGIDPDHCRNVRISDCHIEAGDDCIVLKNTREWTKYGPTENIVVSNCTLKSTSAAVKIGTESVDDFRNIIVQNCVIESSSRGLTIQLRDQGNVENVIFANCTVETRLFYEGWWGRAEPVYITAVRRFGLKPEQLPDWNAGNKLGRVRNVIISNIICRSENGVFIAADPPETAADGSKVHYIDDVTLANVRVEIDKWSKWPGGQYDYRPRYPKMPDWANYKPSQDDAIVHRDTAGVFIENAANVTLRNTRVLWGGDKQTYWGHAVEAHKCPNLKLADFTGEAGREGLQAVTIDD